MKRRGLSPTTRTYQTMFAGLSHVQHWPTHSLQLTHAHQLYGYFTKHLKALKFHTPDSAELTISPLSKYIKILGDAGDFQRIFDVYYAMDSDGPLAPNLDIFTAMFQVLAVRRYAEGDEGVVFHNQNGSTAKLLWTQMVKASKKPPGFTIDSYLIAAAIKALSRGRPADQEFAFDLVRDHLGLVTPGNESANSTNTHLTVHTLAAALDICNKLKKPRHCIYYLQQVMHPRYSSPKSIRARAELIDSAHMEQGFIAYTTLAHSGIPGQSNRALETLQWMLRSEITQGNEKLRPQLRIFNRVLTVCRFSGDWASATKTFELMTGYRAGDFADVEEGLERVEPVKDKRSQGRNHTPDTETMSSMVRTALTTQTAANVRQSLRMVDHLGIDHLLNSRDKIPVSPSRKAASLDAFHHQKLADAVEEAVDFLLTKGPDRQNKETPCWQALRARAKAYLKYRQDRSSTDVKAITDTSSGKERVGARFAV